jgi:hypothetical protein
LIRSELDEGASTWVPYGGSVDVSDWVRDLLKRTEELVEEYKHNKAPAPASRKKTK